MIPDFFIHEYYKLSKPKTLGTKVNAKYFFQFGKLIQESSI